MREAEYRIIIRNLKKDERMTNFGNLLAVVGTGKAVDYLSENDLKNLDYDTYFDEEIEEDDD